MGLIRIVAIKQTWLQWRIKWPHENKENILNIMQDFKNVRSDMFIGVIAHERMFIIMILKQRKGLDEKNMALL